MGSEWPRRRGSRLPVTLLGRTLGVVFFVVGRLRTRRQKALHPRGGVRDGVIRRHGGRAPTGVAWIDEPGTDRVLVRISGATGLPSLLPDIGGLALKIPVGTDGHGDLLLASTGAGPIGRFVVRPVRRPARTYASVMPYRSPTGPLLLAAFPSAEDGSRFELASSGLRGAWSPFAALEVESDWADAPDPPLTFDPVLNQVPGLPSYAWAAQLRRFAYAASRRARGATLES